MYLKKINSSTKLWKYVILIYFDFTTLLLDKTLNFLLMYLSRTGLSTTVNIKCKSLEPRTHHPSQLPIIKGTDAKAYIITRNAPLNSTYTAHIYTKY